MIWYASSIWHHGHIQELRYDGTAWRQLYAVYLQYTEMQNNYGWKGALETLQYIPIFPDKCYICAGIFID